MREKQKTILEKTKKTLSRCDTTHYFGWFSVRKDRADIHPEISQGGRDAPRH